MLLIAAFPIRSSAGVNLSALTEGNLRTYQLRMRSPQGTQSKEEKAKTLLFLASLRRRLPRRRGASAADGVSFAQG